MSKELIEPIEFFKVDKISDDVYVIAPNVVLKFSVSLSKINNKKRYHFHREYEYPCSNADDTKSLVTIKRSFDYYLSIENSQRDDKGNRLFIRIGPSEYNIFMKALDQSVSWFTDTKYSTLFAMNKGSLIVTAPIPSFTIKLPPKGKYLEFIPVVLNKGMANADKEPGVRIYLSDPSNYVDINLDRLMGLHYTVSSFSMYQCALNLVNYLQRPDFGTNRFCIDSGSTTSYNNTYISSSIEGRYVMPEGHNDISKLED